MEKVNAFILGCLVVAFVSCSTKSDSNTTEQEDGLSPMETPDNDAAAMEQEATAVAEIGSASNSQVSGRAVFTQAGDNEVHMEIEVSGLTPGEHALHLHENGDCSSVDASTAGGHWNPTGENHGERGNAPFHKGDIINLEAGDDGKVTWEEDISGWSIGGADSTNIVNKAVIIHAKADDFTSQPAGNAGDRVACGVIQMGRSN